MKKYWIAKTETGLKYGVTQWGEEVNTTASTFEFFTEETSWKQQINHYATKLGETITDIEYMAIEDEDLFPYANRHICVFIRTEKIVEMLLSPYKLLIDYALSLPNKRVEDGRYIYLEHLANEQMTEEQVVAVLESFDAIITRKIIEDDIPVNYEFNDLLN